MLSGCQPFPYLFAGRFYLSPIFLTCPFWELALPTSLKTIAIPIVVIVPT